MQKNKVLMALLSIAVAFGLWVWVVTVIAPDYETTIYNIPVELESEGSLKNLGEYGEGLILMTEKLPEVNLKLYGNRSDLNELNNENITLKVDVSRISEAGEHALTFDIIYPGNINGNEIQVQSRDPGRIVLKYEDAMSKKIPVIKPLVETAEGYVVAEEDLELDFVEVYGPVSLVAPIEQAVINERIQNVSESFSGTYSLVYCDAKGNVLQKDHRVKNNSVPDETITYTATVRPCKTVPLRFNAVNGQGNPSTGMVLTDTETTVLVPGDNGITVVVTVKNPTIEIHGKKRDLSEVEYVELETVDVSALANISNHSLNVLLPVGVQTVSGQATVNVSIRVVPKITRSFDVSNQQFQTRNLQEGYAVSYDTLMLLLNIEATADELDKLTPADIQVEIDLTGITKAGEYEVIPIITLPEGYVLKSEPKVSIRLEEAS